MSKQIVIIGGGIIGCTTAYYLTRHPSYSSSTTSITVLEASPTGIAIGASGKAGGLVARWAYPKRLVDVSFDEHLKLAEEHGGKEKWGFRYVGCGSWEGRSAPSTGGDSPLEQHQGKSLEKKLGLGAKPQQQPRRKLPSDLDWISEELTDTYSIMAPSGHTAQVHPYLFTTSMLDLAKERGASLVLGAKVNHILQSSGKVTSVSYIDARSKEVVNVPATDVIVCAGAWSTSVVAELPISTTKAHSITIRPQPSNLITPYVLFTELAGTRAIGHTEIYPRPDNEVYVCGPGEDGPLPEIVDDVVVDQKTCDGIFSYVKSISPELGQGSVEKRQACFLPLGGPIVGAADSISKGLFIATGHTCWVRTLISWRFEWFDMTDREYAMLQGQLERYLSSFLVER